MRVPTAAPGEGLGEQLRQLLHVARPLTHLALRLAQHPHSMYSAGPCGNAFWDPQGAWQAILPPRARQLPRQGQEMKGRDVHRLPPSHGHCCGLKKSALLQSKKHKQNTLAVGRGAGSNPSPGTRLSMRCFEQMTNYL